MCLVFLVANLAAAQTASPPKKIYRVEMRATTFGGSSYILGFAASDIFNKKSAWVRGSVIESTGTPENIKITGQDQRRRKRTFFTLAAEMFEKARNGEPPFDKKAESYKDLMIMINEQKLAAMIITLDPDIKTLADLKGKRVATWPRGTTKYDQTYKLIAGAGKDVVDSIKWQYTGYAGYDDMILGKSDAAYSFCPERGRGHYTTVPKLKELMSKRKVYFVTATPKMRQMSRELFGDAYGATLRIPAGELAPGVPGKDIICFNVVLAWGIYPDVPDDVVYEIVKTLDENHAMFPQYHSAGKSWVPENYGTYPAAKEYWHPGARKYYDEKGIKYGTEYFFKMYPTD
jgi:TRAP transporter TAXI family solute receptor